LLLSAGFRSVSALADKKKKGEEDYKMATLLRMRACYPEIFWMEEAKMAEE